MSEKLEYYKLHINLQQTIVHTNQANSINSVCAIHDKHKQRIVVRPEYRHDMEQILSALGFSATGDPELTNNVVFQDGFTIDTWDRILYPER